MEASKRAARKFLAELKTINPSAYALLVNNNMGFVGAGDWDTTTNTASEPGLL